MTPHWPDVRTIFNICMSTVDNVIRLEDSLECVSTSYLLWLLKLAGFPVSSAHSKINTISI